MTLSTYSASRPNNVGKYGLANDRKLGESWEARFIDIARLFGWDGWQFAQKKGPAFSDGTRTYISPDVWLLRRGDKQYACEIKHKTPTQYGCYGFEVYRANSLVELATYYKNEFGPVIPIYVIHDHKGNRDNTRNVIHDWTAQYITQLQNEIVSTATSKTYKSGQVVDAPINYYSVKSFRPLLEFLI